MYVCTPHVCSARGDQNPSELELPVLLATMRVLGPGTSAIATSALSHGADSRIQNLFLKRSYLLGDGGACL